MLQILAISTLQVFKQHPDLLKPIHLSRSHVVEHNELPTALAERNIPTLSINDLSTDSSDSNYNQDDLNEFTTPGAKENGEYYTSYGMFVGRPLQYGKLILNLFLNIEYNKYVIKVKVLKHLVDLRGVFKK